MNLARNLHRTRGKVHRPTQFKQRSGGKRKASRNRERRFPRMDAVQRTPEGERWRKPTCHSGGRGVRREGREVRTCEEGCGSGTVTEREMGTLAPLKQPPTGWPVGRHGPRPGNNAIFLGERVPIHFALCSTLSSCVHLQLARWPTALFGRLVGEFLPLPFQ